MSTKHPIMCHPSELYVLCFAEGLISRCRDKELEQAGSKFTTVLLPDEAGCIWPSLFAAMTHSRTSSKPTETIRDFKVKCYNFINI